MRLIPIAAALLLAPLPSAAADIEVIGLISGKAVVVIDKAKPRTMSVGETSPEGVKLVAATSESATFEVAGKPVKPSFGMISVYRIKVPGAKPAG